MSKGYRRSLDCALRAQPGPVIQGQTESPRLQCKAPLNRFQKLAAADARDRAPAGHDRGHRAGHRFGARLSGLAALQRPAAPGAGRPEGLDRVDPSDRGRASSGSRSSVWPSSRSSTIEARRSIVWPTLVAVGLVGFQAWLGRETVRLGNSGESVTAHLAAAMTLVGLLVYLTVRAGYPARLAGRGASQRFTLLAAFGAAATFALLLFGSHVTATDAALVYPDWPLMGGTLFPPLADPMAAHVLHRWVAAVVGVDRRRRSPSSPGGRSASTRRSSVWRSARRSCSRSRSSSAGCRSSRGLPSGPRRCISRSERSSGRCSPA